MKSLKSIKIMKLSIVFLNELTSVVPTVSQSVELEVDKFRRCQDRIRQVHLLVDFVHLLRLRSLVTCPIGCTEATAASPFSSCAWAPAEKWNHVSSDRNPFWDFHSAHTTAQQCTLNICFNRIHNFYTSVWPNCPIKIDNLKRHQKSLF